MRKHWLAIACAASLPVAVQASDETAEEAAWDVEVEAAYLLKRGNSEQDSIVGKANVAHDGERWRHTGKLEGVNTSSRDDETDKEERTAERYFASYKIDRKLSEHNYLFNVATYTKDAFSGFQYEASYAIGLGRRFIETDTQTLDLEAGPGYRVQCLEPETSYLDCSDTEESVIARLAGVYTWQISENATFKEDVTTEIGEDNTTTRAETSLTSKINDHFALRLAHLLKHNTHVPPGSKESDHEVTASLVYTF